VPHNVARRRSH